MPPSPPLTTPVAAAESTNRNPSANSSITPRNRVPAKFGRSLIGTAQTRLSAFCAAVVTASPDHSEVATPITSAPTEPVSDWPDTSLPMIGSFATTELVIDWRRCGSPLSTNPRIVVNTSISGNSEKKLKYDSNAA